MKRSMAGFQGQRSLARASAGQSTTQHSGPARKRGRISYTIVLKKTAVERRDLREVPTVWEGAPVVLSCSSDMASARCDPPKNGMYIGEIFSALSYKEKHGECVWGFTTMLNTAFNLNAHRLQ